METRDRTEQLASLALFDHLSDARRAELARRLDVESFSAGSVIIEEGSRGDTMYLLAQGEVRIEKRAEAGGFRELALLTPGDFFGEMALLEETPRSARAVALGDATLFVLSRADLEQWLEAEPLVALGFFVELLRGVSHRLRRTTSDLVLLHDLSHLAAEKFEDESLFLQAAFERMLPHLGGDWSCAGYLRNEYTGDVTRVAAGGLQGHLLPETLPPVIPPLVDPLRGYPLVTAPWLDPETLCVVLPGKEGEPIGFVVARSATALSTREQADLEVALGAVADLLSSAVQNIQHEVEERLRARLEQQRVQVAVF